MTATFIAAAIAGLAIGLLSGLLGIGGGVIMVPLFRLVFGMTPVGSTATSLFTIIPTSISGTVSHVRNRTCIPKLGIALGIGGACTSPIGVWLAQCSPGWIVIIASALVIGYSALTMLSKALRAPKAAASQPGDNSSRDAQKAIGNDRGEPSDANLDEMRSRLTRSGLAKAVCIGAITGIVSGYVGLGGGFLMVPMMLSFLNMPMKLASGTSLIGVMILAIPATVTQCMLGNVEYLIGVAVACGSIPGAAIGARFVHRVPERTLRFIFAFFLGLAAILLVLNELGLLP